MSEYEEFRASLPSGLGASLVESVPRALLFCFTRGCRECKKDVDAAVYEEEGELWNKLDGPVFHCSMLVDTSCNEPCDWHRIAEEPYDLQRLHKLGYGDFLFAM